MVDSLATTVPSFQGASTRVRCFLHILNLVARVLLAQFDSKKEDGADSLAEALGTMMEGLEVDEDSDDEDEDDLESEGEGNDGTGDDEEIEDNVLDAEIEACVEEIEDLTEEERADLKAAIVPLRQLLKKVKTTHLYQPI